MFVDIYSKWPMAKICQNQTADTVKLLEKYHLLNDVTKTLGTDNVTAFTGEKFNQKKFTTKKEEKQSQAY